MLFDRAQLTAALPQYEVGAELGRGGFGLVIEGRHRRLGRPVAIKILTISGPDVERRFLAEAQVMAVFDHPHVVRVHDYAESDGLCLIVMEHLPGGTLTSRIAAGLRPETACAIGLAIADALHAAHQRGIVHRDIKPDNVLFAGDGAVKVTDFGIAKLFEGSSITSGTLVGTPAYAAPEQILGQRVGPPTDVYAVGGLVYHMLTGRTPFSLELPFSAMLHHHLTQRPELPAGMPPQIASVVGQALEKEPSARPASAKAFALALATAAVADLGSSWSANADTPLRVDDDVRAVMALTTRGAQAQLATRPRSAPRRAQTDLASLQLRTPPPGHLAVPEPGYYDTPPPGVTPGGAVPGAVTTPGYGGPADVRSSFGSTADALLRTPPPGRSTGRHAAAPDAGPVGGDVAGASPVLGTPLPGPPVAGPPHSGSLGSGAPGYGTPVAPGLGATDLGASGSGDRSVSGSHPIVRPEPVSGAHPVLGNRPEPVSGSHAVLGDRSASGSHRVLGAVSGSHPVLGSVSGSHSVLGAPPAPTDVPSASPESPHLTSGDLSSGPRPPDAPAGGLSSGAAEAPHRRGRADRRRALRQRQWQRHWQRSSGPHPDDVDTEGVPRRVVIVLVVVVVVVAAISVAIGAALGTLQRSAASDGLSRPGAGAPDVVVEASALRW